VRGTTGEYSDRTEWSVCAFDEEWKAQRFVEQIETEIRKIEAAGIELYGIHSALHMALAEQIKRFDPALSRIDYTGVRYWVESVDVLDGIPVVHIDVMKLVERVCELENERGSDA
jgi:hypothetical protein